MKEKIKVAVIGGGASGIMAAIAASESGAEVTLFEKNDRVGKKLLATGNGKCNLGNLNFNMEQYFCEDKEKLHHLFEVFSLWDSIAFFESAGLMIKNKEGYLYPYSEQASSVLDVLRMKLQNKNINVVTNMEIRGIKCEASNQKFLVDGRNIHGCFDCVVVACGSPASLKKGEGLTGYAIAESLGHKIHKPVPGLVQLKCRESFMKALAGVRCQAKISLLSDHALAGEETGELQFTEYGISGIPVFQLSRIAAHELEKRKQVICKINFFPDIDKNAFLYNIKTRYESHKLKNLEDFLIGTVHKKINMVIIKNAGFRPDDPAVNLGWPAVLKLLLSYREFILHITACNSMENAQICAGGVDFSEVTEALESQRAKGLYFAGEMIDVDGKCGGFNLQWAWTSGYIAGRNAAGNHTIKMIQADAQEGDRYVKD